MEPSDRPSAHGTNSNATPQDASKPKCCIGLLYFSSSRYDKEKSPVCTGLAKRLRPSDDATHLPTDSIPGGEFKYACVGYAAWDEEGLKAAARRRTSPSDAVQLPYCEGLEVVSSAAVNTRPELLTEGPSFSSGGGRSGGEGGGSDGSSSSDGSTAQRPGRSFVPGPFGSGQPKLPTSASEWEQFKQRFDRVAMKIVDKMAQNAVFMGTTIKKSWEQILRELSGGGGGGGGGSGHR